MGFQDQTLLALLLSLAPKAMRDFIPDPDILLVDWMCCMHKMGSMELTAVELYNFMMQPYREYLRRPNGKTQVIWISVDKRWVPLLKQNTVKKRDKTSAAAAAAAAAAAPAPAPAPASDVEMTDVKQPSERKAAATPPYPKNTQLDRWGRIVPVKLHPHTITGPTAKYVISKAPTESMANHKFSVSALCASRELRHKVMIFMFTRLAPRESKNLPAGTRIVISYSEDYAISPII